MRREMEKKRLGERWRGKRKRVKVQERERDRDMNKWINGLVYS
jgi:hypothetical protein